MPAQNLAVPSLSPLIAYDIVCSQCGQIVKPEVVMSSFGRVECIKYTHINEEIGCRYVVRNNEMTRGEMIPIRPDGTEAKR